VLRALLVGLTVGLVGAGCAPSRSKAPVPGRDAVTVRLEGVVARQYRGADQRFELEAARVRVSERSGRLEAEGGIRGVLDPVLWKEERR